MEIIYEQLRTYHFLTLFLAIGLGYLIGRVKFGKFQLGGIAGTLVVAVILGQVGDIHISDDVKSIFFSLFIFMVGYLGGPQFFASLKPSAILKLLAAVSMTVLGLLVVLGVSLWAGFDKGMAAGLAAGGLTQSAIIGTAGNALDLWGQNAGIATDIINDMKTNVAVGYSVTYIFGSIGPILMVSLIPILMKWDIRKEAIKLAVKLGGGKGELEEGEFEPINRTSTRAYIINKDSNFINKTIKELEEKFDSDITVEAYIKNNKDNEYTADTILEKDDIIIINGLVKAIANPNLFIGEETSKYGKDISFIEEKRKVIVTNRKLHGLTLKELHDTATVEQRHGVYVTEINRMTHALVASQGTEIHTGDEITFRGKKEDLNRVEKIVGYKAPSLSITEFTTFGIGMVIGYLIGEISFEISGTAVALGSGLGCLVSGLIIGFLRTRHPKLGGVNVGAAQFLQSFGLAVFVGVVGINAGEPALAAIKQYGITLFLLGIVVTLVPIIIQFFINYYLLRIKNPIEALGVITGSKSANPAFSTLLDKAGNATPTPTFTMTYAVANIFLTLWGPIIVALIPQVTG